MKTSLLFTVLVCCLATACEPISEAASTAGPERQDYGPNRHPAENAHDYGLRQQGQIGPCGVAWDEFHAGYFAWRDGQIPEEHYRQLEQRYGACTEQNYR